MVVARAEISRMLGVGKARVTQMVAEPGFPAPVAQLTVGRVWLYRDIEEWARGHGRSVRPLVD
jgi:predicted DNA-binding transcriptional regulator AlpA